MVRQYGAPKNEDAQKKQYQDRKDPEPEVKQDPSPSTDVVNKFHKKAQVDTRKEDVHHTIGTGENQAASGAHTHSGGDSVAILDGFVITGSRSNWSTMAPSVVQMLVRLGAKDSTTA